MYVIACSSFRTLPFFTLIVRRCNSYCRRISSNSLVIEISQIDNLLIIYYRHLSGKDSMIALNSSEKIGAFRL